MRDAKRKADDIAEPEEDDGGMWDGLYDHIVKMARTHGPNAFRVISQYAAPTYRAYRAFRRVRAASAPPLTNRAHNGPIVEEMN